jgi:hypothetical protein
MHTCLGAAVNNSSIYFIQKMKALFLLILTEIKIELHMISLYIYF